MNIEHIDVDLVGIFCCVHLNPFVVLVFFSFVLFLCKQKAACWFSWLIWWRKFNLKRTFIDCKHRVSTGYFFQLHWDVTSQMYNSFFRFFDRYYSVFSHCKSIICRDYEIEMKKFCVNFFMDVLNDTQKLNSKKMQTNFFSWAIDTSLTSRLICHVFKNRKYFWNFEIIQLNRNFIDLKRRKWNLSIIKGANELSF